MLPLDVCPSPALPLMDPPCTACCTAYCTACSAWEAVRHAKRPRVHTLIATSDIHMVHKLRMSRDEVSSSSLDPKLELLEDSIAEQCDGLDV